MTRTGPASGRGCAQASTRASRDHFWPRVRHHGAHVRSPWPHHRRPLRFRRLRHRAPACPQQHQVAPLRPGRPAAVGGRDGLPHRPRRHGRRPPRRRRGAVRLPRVGARTARGLRPLLGRAPRLRDRPRSLRGHPGRPDRHPGRHRRLHARRLTRHRHHPRLHALPRPAGCLRTQARRRPAGLVRHERTLGTRPRRHRRRPGRRGARPHPLPALQPGRTHLHRRRTPRPGRRRGCPRRVRLQRRDPLPRHPAGTPRCLRLGLRGGRVPHPAARGCVQGVEDPWTAVGDRGHPHRRQLANLGEARVPPSDARRRPGGDRRDHGSLHRWGTLAGRRARPHPG